MTPTDAQLAAAAKAMQERRNDGGGDLHWYRQMAKTALTAAAEVGLPDAETIEERWRVKYADAVKRIEAKERERCAQVADEFGLDSPAEDIAAAIRAIGDETRLNTVCPDCKVWPCKCPRVTR